jgi:WXG100 family type VII secretion target
MPILHLDSQRVRETGQKLRFMSDVMYGESNRLHSRLTLLQSSWTGSASAQFQEEMGAAIGRLRRLADEADDLNRRLQRKVDEWEEIDRYF